MPPEGRRDRTSGRSGGAARAFAQHACGRRPRRIPAIERLLLRHSATEEAAKEAGESPDTGGGDEPGGWKAERKNRVSIGVLASRIAVSSLCVISDLFHIDPPFPANIRRDVLPFSMRSGADSRLRLFTEGNDESTSYAADFDARCRRARVIARRRSTPWPRRAG
ncbi:hypothetical protein DP44_5790 [Burkholderia pseudomallei]|nr:hypothetical protein DP44_5790 [Burkholderia pseudomallei]